LLARIGGLVAVALTAAALGTPDRAQGGPMLQSPNVAPCTIGLCQWLHDLNDREADAEVNLKLPNGRQGSGRRKRATTRPEGTHASLLERGGCYAHLYNTYFRHQSPDYRPGEGFVAVRAAPDPA
jgi:hypothetical protein